MKKGENHTAIEIKKIIRDIIGFIKKKEEYIDEPSLGRITIWSKKHKKD